MANSQKKNPDIDIEDFQIVNLSYLAEKSGISYNRLYNNLAGIYPKVNLEANEKTRLVNTLHVELKDFLKVLGYKVKFERMD